MKKINWFIPLCFIISFNSYAIDFSDEELSKRNEDSMSVFADLRIDSEIRKIAKDSISDEQIKFLIRGRDEDMNGVRDFVDIMIRNYTSDPVLKKALTNFARSWQLIMEVNSENREDVYNVYLGLRESSQCIKSIIDKKKNKTEDDENIMRYIHNVTLHSPMHMALSFRETLQSKDFFFKIDPKKDYCNRDLYIK